MTKRDYIAVAAIIRNRRPLSARKAPIIGRVDVGNVVIDAANDTLDFVARDFADMFETDNPRFNRPMFLEACGNPAEVAP